MHIRPIRSEDDYAEALSRVENLWGAEEGSDAGDELDVLIILIQRFEEERWPTPEVKNPLGYLQAFMELGGRTQRDLSELLGSRSRASEILRRRRNLNLDQIRLLHSRWGIPTDCLVGELVAA